MIRTTLFFLVGALLAGCAPTAGVDFRHPAADQLVLGQTSTGDIRALLGPPHKQVVSTATPLSDEDRKKQSPMDPDRTGATATFLDFLYAKGAEHREMAFIFEDDKLASYMFISNFANDSSDFDDSKVSLLKRGATTEGEAIQYFGPPLGRKEYPQVRDKGSYALFYAYTEKLPMVGGKDLMLLFGRNNILQDYKFNMTGAPKS
jgi:hypothetical protein